MTTDTDVAKSQAPPKRPPKGIPLDSGGNRESGEMRNAERSPTRSVRHLPLREDSVHQDEAETVSSTNDPDPLSRRPARQTYANTAAQPVSTISRHPPTGRSLERSGESRQMARPVPSSPPLPPPPILEDELLLLQTRLAESEENMREALSELEKEKHANQELQRAFGELNEVIDSLQSEVGSLKGQLNNTRTELEDNRSHILSMQPYVRDTTPEEVGRDFDDLYESVCNWVETWMTPVFDNEDCCKEVYNIARKNVLRTANLKNMMNEHSGLYRITKFPDTNQDTVVAIVMRFLHENVLTKVLCDLVSGHVNILEQIEESMRESVQPKRDLFAVRNWRAEAFTSLVNVPGFARARTTRCEDLTVELGKMFLILVPHALPNEFYRSLDEKVIRQAVALQEKIQSSIHHYWFALNDYGGSTLPPAARGKRNHAQAAAELLDELDQVECEDVFRNRRRFDPAKHLQSAGAADGNNGGRNEVLHRLYPICTLSPRLMMRQVGRGEIIKEPTVVRRQRTLIAWASPESRIAKVENEGQTLMNALYYVKPHKTDGGAFYKWG